MIQLTDTVYYDIVPKELLRKNGYDLPELPDTSMRLKAFIPIGQKDYDQMNGYKPLLKGIKVDFSTHTLIIFEFDKKRPCELIDNLFR